jgi:hypothetical protein
MVGFLNAAALWFLIAFTFMFVTRNSWDTSAAKNLYGYPPPWACLLLATCCGSIPVLTAAVVVRGRIRRTRQRQVLGSELPETSDLASRLRRGQRLSGISSASAGFWDRQLAALARRAHAVMR